MVVWIQIGSRSLLIGIQCVNVAIDRYLIGMHIGFHAIPAPKIVPSNTRWMRLKNYSHGAYIPFDPKINRQRHLFVLIAFVRYLKQSTHEISIHVSMCFFCPFCPMVDGNMEIV